ncbi:hypothetical protein F5887DRAFT_1003304 [Amanita rubescens]|nr:hypothetical protein F5887DRAFT_1003304 [Amanita rubescens]
MPAPAYIVAAGLTAAAATFVFVRFVYEPHIAPALERLAEDFLERRRAAKREREDRERLFAHPIQEIPLDIRTTALAPPSRATRSLGTRPGSSSGSGTASASRGDGDNTREGVTPRCAPAPAHPYPVYVSASGTETGTVVGRTPEEVNEWRKAVSQRTSTSLRQRRSRVAPAQPGNGSDAPRNTFNNADDIVANVWNGNSALPHVLDEPNHPIPHQPIQPTPPRARSTTLSPSTLPRPFSTNVPHQRTLHKNQQSFSNDFNPSHASVSTLTDSHVSISSPSTLGLGLGPVFTVGEIDESVHGSSPSTQKGDQLPNENVPEALVNPAQPTQPTLSLSQSYPITLDQEQGIELVSNPSESEHEPSEYAFGGSEFGSSASPDRPSSPEWDSAVATAAGRAGSPFIQLSPPQLPVVNLGGGSVPTIRQVLERAEREPSLRSQSSLTMFHSFTDDHVSSTRQNVAQAHYTPDIFSPTLSELEFSSDDGHTSPFNSNDEFGSESSWTSARV